LVVVVFQWVMENEIPVASVVVGKQNEIVEHWRCQYAQLIGFITT